MEKMVAKESYGTGLVGRWVCSLWRIISQSASSMWPFHPATWLRPAAPIVDTAELLPDRPGPIRPCHANLQHLNSMTAANGNLWVIVSLRRHPMAAHSRQRPTTAW